MEDAGRQPGGLGGREETALVKEQDRGCCGECSSHRGQCSLDGS